MIAGMSRWTWLAASVAIALSMPLSAPAVTTTWVKVNGPGNACDPQAQGCFGSVADSYRIAKYEVTNEQYAEFLNSVAADDPQALYNPAMGTASGGIARTGNGPGGTAPSATRWSPAAKRRP